MNKIIPIILLSITSLTISCRQEKAPATLAPEPEVIAQSDYKILTGKWLRPDGGYILDIRAATEDGKLDAGYFNPNPINVSDASWRRSEELGLVISIELRDVNYPGATYRLYYRPDSDTLTGAYHQPALGQTFEVFFERAPL